jgi:hypothetical protein
MNVEKFRTFLEEKNLLVRDRGKSIIATCPFCGDHRSEKKKGHLYFSPDIGLYHCFYCGESGHISTFIKKFTGNNKLINEVFTKEELESSYNKKDKIVVSEKPNRDTNKLSSPEIDTDSFLLKRNYIIERLNGIAPEQIPNLVLNISGFYNDNKLQPSFDTDYINTNCVGFLTKHHCKMICRNINKSAKDTYHVIKFKEDAFDLLDYYYLESSEISNTVVLAEGCFDILAEYFTDSLKIKNGVRVYASAGGFDNMSSLLKSVCFDYHLFQPDVIILSDSDKKILDYEKFIQNNNYIINNLEIYYNRSGKDFACFPINPFKGGTLKDVQQTIRKNKKGFQRYSANRH